MSVVYFIININIFYEKITKCSLNIAFLSSNSSVKIYASAFSKKKITDILFSSFRRLTRYNSLKELFELAEFI